MIVKEYGYEYDAIPDESLWNKTRGKTATGKLWNALCLRSGRDALKTIAREYKPSVVLLPALSCESMILPFIMFQHEIRYYRLTEQYSVDIDHLISQIHDTSKTVLLLYMNYFGNPAITDMMLFHLKNKYQNMVFIEDITHTLAEIKKTIFIADYIIASLRKWMNIPDGGLIWTKIALHNECFGKDLSFSESRLKAQYLRYDFFQRGDPYIKTEYIKIFSTVSEIINSDKNPSLMSEYAYCIAQKTDWGSLIKRRKENSKTLIKILHRNTHIRFIQNKTGVSDLYVPIIVKNRDKVQNLLSSLGVFNTVIWPLNDEQKTACSNAKYTSANMLAVPCDQRYTKEDMYFIGNEIVKAVHE